VLRSWPTLFVLGGLACAQSAPADLVSSKSSEESTSTSPRTPATADPTRPAGLVSPPHLAAVPGGTVSLFGGTIQSVDHIRDQMILQIFQGRRTPILFDERTRVFRDGKASSPDDLQNGERAYVDTTLDGSHIFARTIRITNGLPGKSEGQVVDFDASSGELRVRDILSPNVIKMHLAGDAKVLDGTRSAASSDLRPGDLRPGMLVSLAFVPDKTKEPVCQRDLNPGDSRRIVCLLRSG